MVDAKKSKAVSKAVKDSGSGWWRQPRRHYEAAMKGIRRHREAVRKALRDPKKVTDIVEKAAVGALIVYGAKEIAGVLGEIRESPVEKARRETPLVDMILTRDLRIQNPAAAQVAFALLPDGTYSPVMQDAAGPDEAMAAYQFDDGIPLGSALYYKPRGGSVQYLGLKQPHDDYVAYLVKRGDLGRIAALALEKSKRIKEYEDEGAVREGSMLLYRYVLGQGETSLGDLVALESAGITLHEKDKQRLAGARQHMKDLRSRLDSHVYIEGAEARDKDRAELEEIKMSLEPSVELPSTGELKEIVKESKTITAAAHHRPSFKDGDEQQLRDLDRDMRAAAETTSGGPTTMPIAAITKPGIRPVQQQRKQFKPKPSKQDVARAQAEQREERELIEAGRRAIMEKLRGDEGMPSRTAVGYAIKYLQRRQGMTEEDAQTEIMHLGHAEGYDKIYDLALKAIEERIVDTKELE